MLIVFLNPTPVSAQDEGIFEAGLIGGFQVTQIRGDDLGGYHKIGGSVGFISRVRFHELASFQFEIVYDQFGSKASGGEQPLFTSELKMDYIHLPFLMNVHYKDFSFGGGASYAGLVRFREIDVSGADVSDQNRNTVRSWNLLLALDASYDLWDGLHVGMRYYYSFARFRQSNTRSWFHNVLGFRVYYLF